MLLLTFHLGPAYATMRSRIKGIKIMINSPKTGYKLPIWLMIGPAASIVGAFLLFAIIRFSVGSQSSGDDNLFGDGSMFNTVTNILLFLLGALGIVAFIPCFIAGIIILSKRSKDRSELARLSTPRSPRDVF